MAVCVLLHLVSHFENIDRRACQEMPPTPVQKCLFPLGGLGPRITQEMRVQILASIVPGYSCRQFHVLFRSLNFVWFL